MKWVIALARNWRSLSPIPREIWLAKSRHATRTVGDKFRYRHHAGARLPYGDEPDPITHLQTVAPHHAYYYSGISDILTLDETIKRNPQALVQLCLGAFKAGMREFTANVSGNDLVRVTGYMVRLSDLEKYRAEGSRTNTTWLGEEAARNTRILERQPRVISHEQQMRFSQ